MTRPSMTVQAQSAKLAMIRTIRSVEELDGWQEQSLRDGQFPGEQAALTWRRIELQQGSK